MTSPWSYTGKAAPQAKPMASSAAPQRPARVVADWVPIHTPNRNQGTHDGKARAQATEQGFKNKTTILQGGTPKRLFPTAVDSADRQHETATAATPDRIKADKKHSLATSAGLQDAPMASRTPKRIEHDRNTHVRTHALHRSAASKRHQNKDIQLRTRPRATPSKRGATNSWRASSSLQKALD